MVPWLRGSVQPTRLAGSRQAVHPPGEDQPQIEGAHHAGRRHRLDQLHPANARLPHGPSQLDPQTTNLRRGKSQFGRYVRT